jgi:tetratricopeptide (TPR) repeat protein
VATAQPDAPIAQPDAPAASSSVDPKQVQAESFYAEGAKQYNLHAYAAAIDAFKRAYDLAPEPTILFDIAQAYRLLKDCENAASFYRTYLRAKPDAHDRDKADKLASEMEGCAAVQLDQRPLPPPTQVVVPGPRSHGFRLAGIITVGVGAALAGTGVYFSLDAADKAHQLEHACMTSCQAADVASIDRDGKSSAQRAVAMYFASGIAIAAGCAIVWTTMHASPDAVQVAPTSGGVTVSTTVRF